MIKFVNDLRQVGGFLPNKTDRHDIAEILLKVVLNTITLTDVKWGRIGILFSDACLLSFYRLCNVYYIQNIISTPFY